MSANPLTSLPPGVMAELLSGIEAPSARVFASGTTLYRFSSSSLFREGFFVSPWWFTREDFAEVLEDVRLDPELLSGRARSAATVPTVWRGNSRVNLLDVAVSATLREPADAFRGPGKDQTMAVYAKGKPSEHRKVLRAPRGVMQNFLPALSWRNAPPPNLVVAGRLFAHMQAVPTDRFSF